MLVEEAIAVRAYEPNDDEFIATVAAEAFSEYTPRAVPHTLAMARRYTTLVALERPRWVPRDAPAERAPVAPRRVGFVVIGEEDSDVFVLNAIAVRERERGRGIGGRLMLAFEKRAECRGARRLELVTADSNLAALDLFLRRGFRLVRRRERFYERGQDACILAKELRQ
jgi:ribosomal protein S18 acetylase RimI-like enzyme